MLNPLDGSGTPQLTSFEAADAIAAHLAQRKDAWIKVDISQRIHYLEQCIHQVMAVSDEWVTAACQAKGIDPNSTLAGEEWYVGPAVVIYNLRLLIHALRANGKPRPPRLMTRNGQIVAQVFPANLTDRLLLLGFVGEVWMVPGKPATQGMVYREKPATGKVALVLGAGNLGAIAPMDALYQLFAHDTVVLLKMNPVNEYMGPILAAAFEPLRRDGFLEIVYGGADLGRYLCQHPQIDTIHITGSQQTHDAIVWGATPAEQVERKAAHQPVNLKPITSELGCVTPVIVVPGRWSPADLAFQARHVAEMVVHNASFNCCSAKLLVTAKGWAQRHEFLYLLQRELSEIPPREAYYPGAKQRYLKFLERYPQAQPVNSGSDTIVPWTLIPDVPAETGEYALTQEAFCGVLAEVNLDAMDPGDFLEKAVAFVNQNVWGNLSCTLLVDPRTQRQWTAALEVAIANLQYGAIGVNVWSSILFAIPIFPWGAYPGNSLDDIRSGQGMVHNTYLFEYPQKSVLRAPFRIIPTPIWFSRHRNLRQLTQRFAQFEADPNPVNFLQVVLAALQDPGIW
jgi:acyl-CoA reductase-like NAD-dependent aldehyde dehydrogenase